jgi:RNA polymerase sigma-70 factor (ECF subfamily)
VHRDSRLGHHTSNLAPLHGARYHAFSMDETALIGMAKQGDLLAFNRLIAVHQTRLFNVAYRIMGDPDDAADATQEALISAFRKLSSYRGGSFRAWLMRIVTNACYDELRRRKRRPAVSMDDLGEETLETDEFRDGTLRAPQDGPEKEAMRSELARAIQDCLDRLPDEFRVVAVLADVQGYEYREVSEVVGKPLGTIKSRLARARARLRDCLQRYGELLPESMRQKDEMKA